MSMRIAREEIFGPVPSTGGPPAPAVPLSALVEFDSHQVGPLSIGKLFE
jgi:hypothetical protein